MRGGGGGARRGRGGGTATRTNTDGHGRLERAESGGQRSGKTEQPEQPLRSASAATEQPFNAKGREGSRNGGGPISCG